MPIALATGAAAGLASGLFGVGGGVVIVPALIGAAAFDQRRAHATSLAAICAIAASATAGYATAGEIRWSIAVAMASGALLGAPIGTAVLGRVDEHRLRLAFATLLIVTALRLITGGITPASSDVATSSPAAFAAYAVLGLAGGLLAGLMGVGGGIITVPALSLIAGLPLLMAKGVSLAVIVPGALVGTVRNHRRGLVDLRGASAIAISGIVAALLASRISLGIDPRLATTGFAALLVVTATRLLRRHLGRWRR